MTDKPEVIEAESESTAVAAIDSDSPEAMLADLEKQVELSQKIRNMAVKMTTPNDWLGMGKYVYLQATGAERIASVAGLVRRILDGPTTEWHEDEKGKYFTVRYLVALETRHGQIVIEEQGFASSRDQFLGTGKGAKLESIDRTIIERKALNNGFVRAISRRFGLRGLTIEDLKSFGENVKIQEVNYGGKSGGKGSTQSKQKAPSIPEDLPDVPDSVEGMKGWSDQALVGVWLREIKRAKAEYDVQLDELFLDGLKGEPGYWKMNPGSANKMTPKRRDWFRAKLIEAVKGYPPIEQINDENAGEPADEGEINEDDIPWGGSAE